MGLTLTILGCSGSYPGPGQACSGYLIRTDTTAIWMDAGSGSLANLQRHVDLDAIDAVVLSHEHPDHCEDLSGFYVACKYYLHRQQVPVFAPASVRAKAFYKGAPLEWHIVSDGVRETVGDITLTFSQTQHPPETLAVRADGGGRSLGYSADSGPAWELSALGPGLDLALCEATYLQHDEGKADHMSARQAGHSGRRADVGRLVLTHLQPGLAPADARAEAELAFGRVVDVALIHEVYEV